MCCQGWNADKFIYLFIFLENLNCLSLKPLIAIALLFNLVFSTELQILPSSLCFHYFFVHSFFTSCTVSILKLWAQLLSVPATCFTFSLVEGVQIPLTQIYPFCFSCSLSHHSVPESSLSLLLFIAVRIWATVACLTGSSQLPHC